MRPGRKENSMGSVMKHNKIVVAALAVCAAFGANAAFDADYLRPVRPIGVDGQLAWNGRSIFFMYPPTFGFERRDGAASYRFTVKDEAGVERSLVGRSPNDSLAPVWAELPLSLCSVSSVSSATSTTADLDALAREDYAHAIRPGGVDGSPFWNKYSRMFMYPPAFEFSKGGPGTVKYRFTVLDAAGKTHVFDAPSSQSPLTPVWNDIATGQAWVYVSAVDKDGKVHGIPDWPRDRFLRSFWRSAPFRPGSYPPAPRSYAEAVAKCGDEIFERPATQYFLKTGKPDPNYTHNCYPAKMHSALILGMLDYATRRPDRAEDALKLARNVADFLISISQPKGAPLEYWPPTYADRRAAGSFRYGQNMLIYPCNVGAAYLALYDHVKDAKYLDAAKRIADTYV